ncbi:MAG: aminoglycoside 6-adenylyltransferase [Anaerolineales bacterium]|nr:aminoglycoside 6-adenylyltransferase [Anaerolineales bacterium]
MPDAKPYYEELIWNFLQWAEKEDNIRAAAVIGSRARTKDHPADEWSDLDLLVVAVEPRLLIEHADWLGAIGEPWITFLETTPDGGCERRALFAGGLDVDFAPVPAGDLRALQGKRLPPILADIFRRGVRVILDKDGVMEQIRPPEAPSGSEGLPENAVFLDSVNDFWYHAVWTAKHLRRGELWWTASCSNMRLQNLIRRMLEWHARAARGPAVDTWMRGRFLEEWVDPKAVAALEKAFAHYDAEDVWRAVFASMDLFHGLAAETAGSLHIPYPAFGEAKARELVRALHAGRRRLEAAR